MLVAAMNPCPCGYYGHPHRDCTCSPTAVHRYLSRISGPLLDRFDLHVEVPPVEYESLTSHACSEPSSAIRERVNQARRIQQERYHGTPVRTNAGLTPALLRKHCLLSDDANALMQNAFDRLGLSARAYDRLLKVARTIADLDGSEVLHIDHLSEAIQYRSLDRKYWQTR